MHNTGPSRRTEYLEAVSGEAIGATEAQWDRVAHVPDIDEWIAKGLAATLGRVLSRVRDRPHPVKTAFDIVEEATDDVPTQHYMLAIIAAEAKTDSRWWGVEFPDREDWCAICNRVFDITEMEEGPKCKPCVRDGSVVGRRRRV